MIVDPRSPAPALSSENAAVMGFGEHARYGQAQTEAAEGYLSGGSLVGVPSLYELGERSAPSSAGAIPIPESRIRTSISPPDATFRRAAVSMLPPAA